MLIQGSYFYNEMNDTLWFSVWKIIIIMDSLIWYIFEKLKTNFDLRERLFRYRCGITLFYIWPTVAQPTVVYVRGKWHNDKHDHNVPFIAGVIKSHGHGCMMIFSYLILYYCHNVHKYMKTFPAAVSKIIGYHLNYTFKLKPDLHEIHLPVVKYFLEPE